MSWRMSGTYVANCSCQLICGCSTDNPPTGPDGQCRGTAVFHIGEGNLDDVDLSGVDFVFCNLFPSNLTAGNWKVGVLVDDQASDEQARAIERILHGDEGGPFADFSGFYGEWLGMERASVSFEGGERPTASVGSDVRLSFEPLVGADGSHTTVKSALFGFAPEYRVGRANGHSDLFGLSYDSVFAETADFEFASEMAPDAPKGRV